ncbi:hypothetical protein Hanom_Chr12g01081291 [Helianthus anomalus]
MDGVNKPDENGKISNLLDPNTEKQTFGRKSQTWPNLRDENGTIEYIIQTNLLIPHSSSSSLPLTRTAPSVESLSIATTS